ncbi:hypothetical protein RINTHH_11190 [Richelia intracellularis HH01]|uniref:Uncharacterized protein n=1 Tax=Richelia intracellularis HH01 TaxID=1165094 RepID=M1WS71_9NOST|nr:hypothetical protein [Richelia intracellularis]CCH67274.1 hypothetical protein RINTHH_11190 [Richelia intracellularis HH01]HAE05395.1 hypothetical protein [Richelia sp.]
MRLDSTVILTLTLLTLMLGAGSLSAFWGFTLGSAALEGVSTPDTRPTNKFANSKGSSSNPEGTIMLDEKEILKKVKLRIEGKSKNAAKKLQNLRNRRPYKKEETFSEQNREKFRPGFPIKSEDKKVSLSVQSVRFSGGALEMQVKMQNKSSETARFLYTFLEVIDDKGRTLSASTEGLPVELLPEGPTYTGRIIIPTILLDEVEKISLTLTDYPDQKLRLEISDIPIEI